MLHLQETWPIIRPQLHDILNRAFLDLFMENMDVKDKFQAFRDFTIEDLRRGGTGIGKTNLLKQTDKELIVFVSFFRQSPTDLCSEGGTRPKQGRQSCELLGGHRRAHGARRKGTPQKRNPGERVSGRPIDGVYNCVILQNESSLSCRITRSR